LRNQLCLSAIPRRREEVVGDLTGDEAVLLHPLRREIKVLNQVGARTWSLIDGNRTVVEIVSVICEEYEATTEQVESDTLAFLEELQALEIVECDPPVGGQGDDA